MDRPQDQLGRDVDQVASVRHEHRPHGTSPLPHHLVHKDCAIRRNTKDQGNGNTRCRRGHRAIEKKEACSGRHDDRVILWKRGLGNPIFLNVHAHTHSLPSFQPRVLHDTTLKSMQGFELSRGLQQAWGKFCLFVRSTRLPFILHVVLSLLSKQRSLPLLSLSTLHVPGSN